MDVTHIVDPLNDAQRKAVTAAAEHRLILAGAGSGKTRVLVHRIAWLMAVENVSPYAVLAVTFTNKAAAEMRKRIEIMLNRPVAGMWVGTFHGISHRLLRANFEKANLPQGFQILDSDDQFRIIKRLVRGLDLDEAQWPPRRVQWFINQCKDEGQRANQVEPSGDSVQQKMIEIYQLYEQSCQRSGLVDFGELLIRSHLLLSQNPELLLHYQQRFSHLLIDEFQDTNTLQYAWIKLLAGESSKVFVVGDDDQSIYGWRGAKIENIQRFSQDFVSAEVIKLEQNYRSTGNILEAANALITNNTGRLGKELWSAGEKGDPIGLYAGFNDYDEARFIVDAIQSWVKEGNERREVAILYRSNAQSRVFEECLMSASVPYRVYGGLRFFDRAEIKDALAYLRLMQNRDDDAAFERIINTPPRGIGNRTVEVIRDYARDSQKTMWNAGVDLLNSTTLSGRAQSAVKTFFSLIDEFDFHYKNSKLDEQVNQTVQLSGLYEYLGKDKSEKGQSRTENLDELVNAAKSFEKPAEDEDLGNLDSFLAHAALESGEGQADEWEDCVQLMTLHSAKGLEFPLVFMSGMEEGLFPHSRSIEDSASLEEERRLCYVGITRAKKKLILSYAEVRRMHGQESHQRVSCFINEIPKELLHELRPKVKVSRPVYRGQTNPNAKTTLNKAYQEEHAIKLGTRVQHKKFGEGTILAYEGDGKSKRVQINFEYQASGWYWITSNWKLFSVYEYSLQVITTQTVSFVKKLF